MNWRSVASSAASGMLLTIPIAMPSPRNHARCGTQRTPGSKEKLRPDAPCSITTGITSPAIPPRP